MPNETVTAVMHSIYTILIDWRWNWDALSNLPNEIIGGDAWCHFA